MTAFNRVVDNLRVKLPGATDLTLMLELFNTVSHACKQGDVYIEQTQFLIAADTYTYDVPLPVGVNVIPTAVFALSHTTYPINEATYDPDTRRITLLAAITAEHVGRPVTVTAKFAPNPVYTALDLASVAAAFPPHLWDRHYQMMVDGTLARMFAQVAKPYSNREMAALHMRLFRNALSLAKAEQVKGHMPGAQAWSFPPFA